MMASSPSGVGSVPTTEQMKGPRRHNVASTESERSDHQGIKKASVSSWAVSSAGGCGSFGDGRVNGRGLLDVNRPGKEAAGHRHLGKVRLKYFSHC